MKKQLLFAATLIVALCSCDPSRTQRTESDDLPITGQGVGQGGSSNSNDRPVINNNYPNRRKHAVHITSINVDVNEVKFFEGPYWPPPKEQRKYRVSFDRRNTRYINWELNLFHKPPGQPVHFNIDAQWYQSGELFYRYTTNNSIQADWENSYWSHSYSMSPWTPGIYRVDLSIAGQKIASEYFDVYNANCSGSLTFPGTGQVDQLRREAESYRYNNDSRYQDTLLQLAVALHNRGGQCFLNGNLDAAYEDLSETIKLQPSFGMAYYHRALVLLDLKHPKEAVSDLEIALRDKANDDYYAARARAQFALENDPQALSDLDNAIRINSKRPELYHDRGIVLYYLGEDQTALEEFKKAASMYQSQNESKKYQDVNVDIDILEGRKQGILTLNDRGRLFTLAELN
jgi:tetratricopeptide (TPR) repeat protein